MPIVLTLLHTLPPPPSSPAWCKHIGSLLIYRCVCQAMMMSLDPREHDQVNWGVLAGGFVSAKDLELIWCLIKREVCILDSVTMCISTVIPSQKNRRTKLSPEVDCTVNLLLYSCRFFSWVVYFTNGPHQAFHE